MNRQQQSTPHKRLTALLLAVGWLGLGVVLINPKIGYTERSVSSNVVVFGEETSESSVELELVMPQDEAKDGSLLDFLLVAGVEDALSIHESASLYTDVQRLQHEKFRVYKRNGENGKHVYEKLKDEQNLEIEPYERNIKLLLKFNAFIVVY